MTNPLRRNGHGTTEQPASGPTSIRCCGPTHKPDLRDVVCCGQHANDSHTGVRWMLLNGSPYPFSSPREHRILVWFSSIQRTPVCETFACCPQHTTFRRSGFCVGPQHRLPIGAHAGCSVVPCPFLRRGFVIEQKSKT